MFFIFFVITKKLVLLHSQNLLQKYTIYLNCKYFFENNINKVINPLRGRP